jgi:hypothetical protein
MGTHIALRPGPPWVSLGGSYPRGPGPWGPIVLSNWNSPFSGPIPHHRSITLLGMVTVFLNRFLHFKKLFIMILIAVKALLLLLLIHGSLKLLIKTNHLILEVSIRSNCLYSYLILPIERIRKSNLYLIT